MERLNTGAVIMLSWSVNTKKKRYQFSGSFSSDDDSSADIYLVSGGDDSDDCE